MSDVSKGLDSQLAARLSAAIEQDRGAAINSHQLRDAARRATLGRRPARGQRRSRGAQSAHRNQDARRSRPCGRTTAKPLSDGRPAAVIHGEINAARSRRVQCFLNFASAAGAEARRPATSRELVTEAVALVRTLGPAACEVAVEIRWTPAQADLWPHRSTASNCGRSCVNLLSQCPGRHAAAGAGWKSSRPPEPRSKVSLTIADTGDRHRARRWKAGCSRRSPAPSRPAPAWG